MEMKIVKNILLLQVVWMSLLLTGCYTDYNDPAPAKVYTDADFGDRIVPIRKVLDLYYDKYGRNTVGKGLEVTEDYVIKGKVISNDAYGNIYRTMYIQDSQSAIEIKLGISGIYNEYKVGQTVYVKAKGLVLGNYRYMLSLGMPSVDADYANGYIDVRTIIDAHVFRGEMTKLTEKDTLVVSSPSDLTDDDLGRLVKIKGLTSTFGTVTINGSSDNYPSFLEQVGTVYTNYEYEKVIRDWAAYREALKQYEADPTLPVPVKPVSPDPGSEVTVPTYAFNNSVDKYYVSACFALGSTNYVVRSSGYSRFALNPLPADGEIVDITAIYTKYSSKSGGFIKYQLVLNNVTDVVPQ